MISIDFRYRFFSINLVWSGLYIVLPSLVYPCFEIGIEQDEIRKAMLIKWETKWIEWFCSSSLIPSILEEFS